MVVIDKMSKNRRHDNIICSFQPAPRGFPLATFFSFSASFFCFLLAVIFSSFLRLSFSCSSLVLATGLKKPSSLDCCAVLRFLPSLLAAFRILSSLKPFSSTKYLTSPSVSGASHLKSQCGSSAGRTSGSRKSRRASSKGQSSGTTNLEPALKYLMTPSRSLCSRISLRALAGPTPLMGSR